MLGFHWQELNTTPKTAENTKINIRRYNQGHRRNNKEIHYNIKALRAEHRLLKTSCSLVSCTDMSPDAACLEERWVLWPYSREGPSRAEQSHLACPKEPVEKPHLTPFQ